MRHILLSFLFLLFGGTLAAHAQSDAAHPPADELSIRWGVETNRVDDGNRFRSSFTIANHGDVALGKTHWTLYFNFSRQIDPASVTAPVRITRLNGDFYRLEPDADFTPIEPGDQLRVTVEAPGSVIKRIDAPAGFYVVFKDAEGRPRPPAVVSDVTVEPFTRPAQTSRGPGDTWPVPTPATRYADHHSLTARPPDAAGRIVPTPDSIHRRPGAFALRADATIRYEAGLAAEARQLAAGLAAALGRRPRTTRADSAAAITLRRAEAPRPAVDTASAEAYRLTVDPETGITITGATDAGVFYGGQSLEAWLPVAAYRAPSSPVDVPAVQVLDAPRFDHRGLHLDVARNMQSVAAVKRLLDIMAFYKLNTFHFHLTDDEGWRLAVEGLPELTRVGGRRGHTLDEQAHLMPSYGSGPHPSPEASRGSGWYSRADYLDILRYAKARHITVMPEIDVPGHARAAIQAMEARTRRLRAAGDTAAARAYRLRDPDDTSDYESVQGWDDNVMNVCRPSTYRFLSTVVDELRGLHEAAGAPLPAVHVGGDEVPEGAWAGSPICDDYIARTEGVDGADDLFGHFLGRFQDTLATRGIAMAGWEEVGLEEADHRSATTTPNEALVDDDVQPYVWSNIWGGGTEDRAYRVANAGYDVVMSQATNFYFDMAYSKHPQEDGYYWAGFVDTKAPFAFVPFDLYKSADRTRMGPPIDPDTAFADQVRLADTARNNIRGLQGQLWGETLRNPDRMEYMAVPRLLSLAERAWAPRPGWATLDDSGALRARRAEAWTAFANRLGHRELPRLSIRHPDWSYRLPPPGATVEAGTLRANVALPGLAVRYTTDGTRPTATSPRYTGPVPVPEGATVRLRTFDTLGRGGRTVTVPTSP
ncbi:family 20 glycosylhydrolase [Salinibacter ruber]|uniref:family 20 glycosylhydrolase n=1 Tax=Salinibacter ruber TaxID=146919 RepID=UPI0021557E0A|nr:family 20 glycosylhydrolase [Salinibacter ruber]MCS3610192.1 hexosaminidase [Salinibacter ruber]MCS3647750.1 hexosaminidase [Salinibacter ruber]MCS4138187.1 hexosaminidase [Salinibacter ruber]